MKNRIIYILILLTSVAVNSQSYIGFLSDNYSGVHGVISNPASIVDSRFKTDINLLGGSAFVTNDAYKFNAFDILKEDFDFDDQATQTFTTNNNLGFNLDVLGPSFMMNINDVSSIALFTRLRTFGNVNEINGSTIDLLDNFDDNIVVDESDFYTAQNLWGEFGVSYARILYNKEEHFVKGGISLKYLQGAVSAYAYGSDLFLEIEDNTTNPGIDSNVTANGIVTYANSEGEDDFEDVDFDFESVDGKGFGIDLGFIYEWRPDHKNDTYTNKDINKYKLKLGLSVTDIGNINYDDGLEEEYTLNLNSNDTDDLEELGDFSNNFYTFNRSENGYKIKLPTALHINADYNFNNKFYLNLNGDLSLVSKTTEAANSIANLVSLTPRFESKWFSAYLPLSVAQFGGFQAGLGFRAGPLYIGSGSIITALAKGDNSRGADVYAGLKIPIYQGGKNKIKDRDGDGVEDKLDACPKIAGAKDNEGCPWEDTDKDGVFDNLDKCINEVGSKENNGCPILDNDGDGINDKLDKCPEIAGPKENKGCPFEDADKDGIFDNLDKCPKVVGVEENNGCPWGDSDKDGVFDNVDKCPNVKGARSNEGCPAPVSASPIKEEKLKELQAFARAIYFNSGSSVFKAGVRAKLDIIASIMNEYPNARFNIEGHTDSQGAASTNRSLSEKRAKAVVNYLVTKGGVSHTRLSSTGFGENYPIADNETKDGRALNRRVEIKLLR